MFVNRIAELRFLDQVLSRRRPGPGQLVMVYGRRRVGKTALLKVWAERSGVPATYWVAEKEHAPLQRRSFFAALQRSLGSKIPTPDFESWRDVWQAVAELVGAERHIIVLDELPYAADTDPAMLSALQHAWDRSFQSSQVVLVLCGSHVRAMETLLAHQSPLFGRMTGQWQLQPLAFGALRQFLPGWSPEEQVAAYAIVGGVPTYLAWMDVERGLVASIRDVMLAPGSLAMAEAEFLLYDEVREPRTYLGILRALANGQHTLKAIADTIMVGSTHVSKYLDQLQEMRLVERRLPATVHPSQELRSRQGRYHLRDPFLRFYFRFLAPRTADLAYQPERIVPVLQQNLRAFVGQTAWEELARSWVERAALRGELGMMPERVGSHWSRTVQVDVAGVDWRARSVLIGECKWGEDAVDRATVRELVERKTPLLLRDLPNQGKGWQVRHALFTRAGVTPSAAAFLREHDALLVDLDRLYADLDDG
jgi:uncharacterized protein